MKKAMKVIDQRQALALLKSSARAIKALAGLIPEGLRAEEDAPFPNAVDVEFLIRQIGNFTEEFQD